MIPPLEIADEVAETLRWLDGRTVEHWHAATIGAYVCRFERTAEGWRFHDFEPRVVTTKPPPSWQYTPIKKIARKVK